MVLLFIVSCEESQNGKPSDHRVKVEKIEDVITAPEGSGPISISEAQLPEIPEDSPYMAASQFPNRTVEALWERPEPQKAYHVGVLFPTLWDSYWVASNYALITHGARLGVKVTIMDAGGYENYGIQRQQLEWMNANPDIDGILLGANDSENRGKILNGISKPVILFVNPLKSDVFISESRISFQKQGYLIAKYMIEDSGGKDIKAIVFPGPEKSGWAEGYYDGIVDAVERLKSPTQKVVLSKPIFGDTKPKVQMVRMHYMMDNPENYNADYILGCAVAVQSAVKYLDKNRDKHPSTKLLAISLNRDVYSELKKKKVLAAIDDAAMPQAEMALDLMVRHLNGEKRAKIPYMVSPAFNVITPDNISKYPYERLFGPEGFRPIHTAFTSEQEKKKDQ